MLSQLASDNVLAQLSVLFSVGLLRSKFQGANFQISSLWQLGRGKYNVPTRVAESDLESES